MSNRSEFEKRLKKYQEEEKKLKKFFDQMANIRLLIILLGGAISITLFIQMSALYGYLTLGVLLLILVPVIYKHQCIKRELGRVRDLAEINESYLKRLNGQWVTFKDCGVDFVDLNHPYTSDLDIFGPKSLFQWINLANTYKGRRSLKSLLEAPDKGIEAIKNRQEAVNELSRKIDFSQELHRRGSQSKEIAKNPEKLLNYAEDRSKLIKNKSVKSIFYISPLILLLSFVLIFTGSPIPIAIPLIHMVIQFALTYIGYKKTSSILNTVYGFKNNLEAYKNMLTLIEAENVDSRYLTQLKEDIILKRKSASEAIHMLERISNFIDIRYNPLVYFILNATLLWDFHCVFDLEHWKESYGTDIRKILRFIGEFEAISSLAIIKQLYPEWCFPTILEEGQKFSVKEMGHPLIKVDDCKCNDIIVDNNSCIITGSNMSGKTTLLRTIGINLVLAYAGAPLYVKQLETSVMDIFTSMRISDDLNSGISTFYAELIRIKMIIDYSRKRKPMIYLIDEMFRGTNSKDRIIGAQSVLRNLNKDWVIGLISTHDFELCDLELEKNLKVKNYHFTEYYVDNEIKFDYLLRSGRCNTTNAKYLMKMVGINLTE
ncbi:MutS-related protein [Alkaliphilus transvaalensis]|uniref:MutS-related protein n=1 Tax=Alkaliphilus transvaalensis TaxID=114628 RepID=UPI00047EF18F|nr:MutS family DNA mismatch repair protein [Alkaliphilus transvaalensis]